MVLPYFADHHAPPYGKNGMWCFVCFSINNWEKRRARKQQFMLHLSLREDVGKVLYIEPPLNLFRLLFLPFSELKTCGNRARWKRALRFKAEQSDESKKLLIFTPVFFIPFAFRVQFIYNLNCCVSLLIIRHKLRSIGFKNMVLWLYHPFDYPLLRWFKNRVLSVFDWAEEWAEYFVEYGGGRKAEVKRLEESIIKDAGMVFVVSGKMLNKARLLNRSSHHVPDGTEYEIFQEDNNIIPEDIRKIKKPVIGYIGTVGHRFDVELLECLSKELPSCSFVLIGDIHSGLTDISRLNGCRNIYFLGSKEYRELGSYSRCFDVCILPYKPELTSSFPTKLFDYFASGKPVVSTNLIEVLKYRDIVYIAESRDEFIEYVKKALLEESYENKARRLSVARNNSWAERARDIMCLINKETVQ